MVWVIDFQALPGEAEAFEKLRTQPEGSRNVHAAPSGWACKGVGGRTPQGGGGWDVWGGGNRAAGAVVLKIERLSDAVSFLRKRNRICYL